MAYAVYVNLDPRQRKVRIHRESCTNNRKNGTLPDDMGWWVDFETLDEAIEYATSQATIHNLSSWTENKCHCGINKPGVQS